MLPGQSSSWAPPSAGRTPILGDACAACASASCGKRRRRRRRTLRRNIRLRPRTRPAPQTREDASGQPLTGSPPRTTEELGDIVYAVKARFKVTSDPKYLRRTKGATFRLHAIASLSTCHPLRKGPHRVTSASVVACLGAELPTPLMIKVSIIGPLVVPPVWTLVVGLLMSTVPPVAPKGPLDAGGTGARKRPLASPPAIAAAALRRGAVQRRRQSLVGHGLRAIVPGVQPPAMGKKSTVTYEVPGSQIAVPMAEAR